MTKAPPDLVRPVSAVRSASGRYLLLLALVFWLGLGFTWIWSAQMKLTFLDPEYAAWSAKQELVRRCDMGDLLILGDSRAGAGMMPTLLPGHGVNVGVGGAKPVEVYFFLHRALACPNMPHHVILSFDAGHFNSTDTFWERSARFGTFSTADLGLVDRAARETHDDTLFYKNRTDGFPGFMRNWLYAHSFPTLNFASMLRGGLFLRDHRNQRERRTTLLARGHHLFGTADGSSGLTEEAIQTHFKILPVEQYFFDKMLAETQARGIRVDYVVTPINQSTAVLVAPSMRDSFAAFLAGRARMFPNFHVLIGPFPVLPDQDFGDGFSHVNQRGAVAFTAMLATALANEAASQH